MPHKFATDMSTINTRCLLMIKKLTILVAKNTTMLFANPDEDEKQSHRRCFMLKCEHLSEKSKTAGVECFIG